MHSHPLWIAITDFGDSAVLVPLAAVLLTWMAWRHRGAAVLWAVLLLINIAGVALTKIAYMGWGLHPPGWNFIGLSGHSALSMLVWPTVGALMASGRSRLWRWTLPAAGLVLSAAIVVSRLTTDAHTPIEAALGAAWGAVFAAVFLWRLRGLAPRRQSAPAWLLPAVLLVPLVLTYGRIFPTNSVLEQVACALSGRAQAFTRADLEPSG
ncbi:hypothetical protein [Thiomonas intermedia]|uniref:hypothetical protein n=1 Tax=Thiomonas intermedia TaxID=926 RepID=UPI0012AB490A|nr:hypothetical protein [Thiomonas intermedia]